MLSAAARCRCPRGQDARWRTSRGAGHSCVSPHTVLIALSAHEDRGSRHAMRAAGAAEYLLKGGNVDDLLAAITAVGAPA